MLNTLIQEFDVSVSATGAWRTVASVRAGTTAHVKPQACEIHGDGVSGAAKIVQLRLRRVTAGNGTGTTQNPKCQTKLYALAPICTGRVNFTAQPTDAGNAQGDIVFTSAFHPQGGRVWDWTAEKGIDIPAGTELALECLVQSGESAVKVFGHWKLEE